MAVKECGSTKVKGGLLIPFERSFESTSSMMAEYTPSEQQGRRGGGEERLKYMYMYAQLKNIVKVYYMYIHVHDEKAQVENCEKPAVTQD